MLRLWDKKHDTCCLDKLNSHADVTIQSMYPTSLYFLFIAFQYIPLGYLQVSMVRVNVSINF